MKWPHTYGEIRAWDDDTRWELIDGQPYAMASPSWQHQSVLTRLVFQLTLFFLDRGCEVLAAPFDVRLPRGDEADDDITTVVQPDIVVICDGGKLDDRGCRGAPDLVVEILSTSTTTRDMVTKRALYERAGVKQYWIVHPLDRTVTIHRRQGDAGFATAVSFEAYGVVPIVGLDGLSIDWDFVFARVTQPG